MGRIPHVVVMMNEFPDPTALSKDRYHVIDLDGQGLVFDEDEANPFYEDNAYDKAVEKWQQRQVLKVTVADVIVANCKGNVEHIL